MRVARGWIKPTWRAVCGLICAASLAVNVVLLWPRLTLLASAFISHLPSIASCLPLLLGYLTRPDLLSWLVARSHLYVLLNLILMRILYRSGILSRPPPSPAAPAFALGNTSCIPKKQHLSAIHLSLPDHDDLIQAKDHELLSHVHHSKVRHYPHAGLTAASFSSRDASSCVDHQAVDPMVLVVDLAAKKGALQKSIGAVPEVHNQLLGMKSNRSKQKQEQKQSGCPHDEVALAATAVPEQIKNIMTTKKDKICNKRPSLFSIEPLSNTMTEGDRLDAQPLPDKKMTRSYTVNNKAASSPFSDSASAGPSFQRSASEARRNKVLAAAHFSNANCSINGTDRNSMENKPSSLIHSGDPYYDLSIEEFKETVETFISKFQKKLSMQRQDSFNRLLGLVNGIQ